MLLQWIRSALRPVWVAAAVVAFSTQSMAIPDMAMPSGAGDPMLDALADPEFLDGVFGAGTAEKLGLADVSRPRGKGRNGRKQAERQISVAGTPLLQFNASTADLVSQLAELRLASVPRRPGSEPAPPSVPEPGGVWLLGAGALAGLAARRWARAPAQS